MFDEDNMILMAECVMCGATMYIRNPDTAPSVWINEETRCPVRPDGTSIEPGEPGTHREPVCLMCQPRLRAAVGRSVPVVLLFPHARLDRITPQRSDGQPPTP